MSLGSRFVRPVTVLSASTSVDRYGNTVADWTSPTSRAVSGWVLQTGSVEDLIGRDATTTVAVVFLPAGDPITALDRVQLDGAVYMVDGVPLRAFGRRFEHHVQVRLKDVEG